MVRRNAAVTAVLLALLMASACTDHGDGGNGSGGAPTSAATVAVTRRNIVSVVSLSAEVESHATVMLGAPAKIQDFRAKVHSGDVVERGGLLARGVVAGKSFKLKAPADVTVSKVLVANGATAPQNAELISVTVNNFVLHATAGSDLLYRLQGFTGEAKAQIQNGPGPFDCPLIGQPVREDDQVSATCLPPASLKLFPGVSAVMAVDVGERKHVLTLPLSAVAGAAERGTVSLVGGSGSRKRQVRLGLSDGSYIEIVSGLAEGDKVLAAAPDLAPADQTH